MRAIAAARGNGDDDQPLTVVEESPNKSSASLGGAERFAETIGGLIRTLQGRLRAARYRDQGEQRGLCLPRQPCCVYPKWFPDKSE
eukprot:2475559-Heterocapsa_arctica.AAC.1